MNTASTDRAGTCLHLTVSKAAKLGSTGPARDVDLVTLGDNPSTLPHVPRQFGGVGPTPADVAKTAANHFRDLWAKALSDDPHGPDDPRYDHTRFLDPNYLKSVQYPGHTLIVPGNAKASYLPQMISGADGAEEMPPDGDISDSDRAALLSAANDWINQNAVNWDPLPSPAA